MYTLWFSLLSSDSSILAALSGYRNKIVSHNLYDPYWVFRREMDCLRKHQKRQVVGIGNLDCNLLCLSFITQTLGKIWFFIALSWFLYLLSTGNWIEYSDTSLHKLNPFHNSGRKPNLTKTESNFCIRLTLNLTTEFDSVVQLSLWAELWKESNEWN